MILEGVKPRLRSMRRLDLSVQGYATLMGLSDASVTGSDLWAVWRRTMMIG